MVKLFQSKCIKKFVKNEDIIEIVHFIGGG